MSVDSAYSLDRGITKCLLVEGSRTTKEKRLIAAAKRGCDAALTNFADPTKPRRFSMSLFRPPRRVFITPERFCAAELL